MKRIGEGYKEPIFWGDKYAMHQNTSNLHYITVPRVQKRIKGLLMGLKASNLSIRSNFFLLFYFSEGKNGRKGGSGISTCDLKPKLSANLDI